MFILACPWIDKPEPLGYQAIKLKKQNSGVCNENDQIKINYGS
jgi:hypothetical protein